MTKYLAMRLCENRLHSIYIVFPSLLFKHYYIFERLTILATLQFIPNCLSKEGFSTMK